MKTYLLSVILVAGVSTASADWYWVGGESITTEGWKETSNWNSSANGEGSSPQAIPGWHRSENWDTIYISNSKGTVSGTSSDAIEGWNLKLNLQNSDLELDLVKFQNGSGDGTCSIVLDADSSLTLNILGNLMDGKKSLDVAGQLLINIESGMKQATTWNVTLRGDGQVSIANVTSGKQPGLGTMTFDLSKSTLFSHDESGNVYEIRTVKVLDLSSVEGGNITLNSYTLATGSTLGGLTATLSEGGLIADADHLGYYNFSYAAADGVYVNYVTSTGSPAVPEPATATLSLLALAGLCARRRRQ